MYSVNPILYHEPTSNSEVNYSPHFSTVRRRFYITNHLTKAGLHFLPDYEFGLENDFRKYHEIAQETQTNLNFNDPDSIGKHGFYNTYRF